MVVNICPRCGKLLKDSKYCDSCGNIVNLGEGIKNMKSALLPISFTR